MCGAGFGQKHETIKIVKPQGETIDGIFYADTTADIQIGDRIVRDNDTISKSILLKAGGISIANSDKKTKVTSFISAMGIAGGFVEWTSNSGSFIPRTDSCISHAPKGTYLVIKKVCFRIPSGKYYVTQGVLIKIWLPDQIPPPPPPPDTTKKWESKLTISVNGISKGRISKKELMNAKTVDITGPYDSIAITAFTMTLIYNTKDMYTSSQAQKSDQLSSQTNEITVGQYALIKKAPANTSFIISEIRYRINGKEYTMRKTLTLVIE